MLIKSFTRVKGVNKSRFCKGVRFPISFYEGSGLQQEFMRVS